MFSPAMDNVLNAMYAPNDKLGVELMGATKWNGLKRAVSALSQDAVSRAIGNNPAALYNAAKRAANRANSRNILIEAARRARGASTLRGDDPFVYELLGVNENYCSELLGDGFFSDLWGSVKSGTHWLLEKGEDIPIINASVERFRQTVDTAKGVNSASGALTYITENSGKILLFGLGAGVLVYLLTRKKGRR